MEILPYETEYNIISSISRGEFCGLAVRTYEKISGREMTERAKFTDVSITSDGGNWTQWALDIEKMAGLGIVTGIGNDRFNPEGEITREQAAVILVKLMESLGQEYTSNEMEFTDNDEISDWAKKSTGIVQSLGVMSGTGSNKFSPKDKYTKEQAVVTMIKVYDLMKHQE